MEKYNHSKIEKKWQEKWHKDDIYRAEDFGQNPKFYSLVEFPYPSGEGLHVGHVKSYTAMDIISRKKRREGFSVLYPIGYDAFGLPAENYAVKTGIHPKITTEKNIENYRKQLKSIGLSFDWSREFSTADPGYYKWTQWLFLKFFEHGLAHKAKVPINWCKRCNIGLANEEVLEGACERCGGEVEKREKEQWMLAITEYADRLIDDLEEVDYLPRIKKQQINWIGRSEGAEITFKVKSLKSKIEDRAQVFTTRPDTLFGATYLVVAPEHKIISNFKSQILNPEEVEKYIKEAVSKTDMERTEEGRGKTGVRLEGIIAVNPGNGEEIPVFTADYVLVHYGTGAIMAVPAHDDRDLQFARGFGLNIRPVIEEVNNRDEVASGAAGAKRNRRESDSAYAGEGTLINSGKWSGKKSKEAGKEMTAEYGRPKTVYKLRDWIFSRQRYWGEPIPLIFCPSCKEIAERQISPELRSRTPKSAERQISPELRSRTPKSREFSKGELLNPGWVAVAEKDLPVLLPELSDFKPSDSGEAPLSKLSDWVSVECPKCGGSAKRETDTMPNWAGSSWYFLRYTDPRNDNEFASREKLDYWMAVDWYNGGMEHTTLHLLYSRFWHKFLYDIGLVPSNEPYKKRTAQGLILGQDGDKMSKSKGNVVNPNDIVERFGADTLRLYEMFMGPFGENIAWSEDGLLGPRRFLEKVWRGFENIEERDIDQDEESLTHKTIKKVGEDIESMKFNTAISALMSFWRDISLGDSIARKSYKRLLELLSPFAPHLTEELWRKVGEMESIHLTPWPAYDKNKTVAGAFSIVVQIDGKTKAVFETRYSDEEAVKKEALKIRVVKDRLKDKEIDKFIYIPQRLLNIVVKKSA